ncbi:hypothetical protein [Nonomuraea sp. SYSU D8015]|uniref:hypothetical protein n=1 Tax=Nonomuraea sp. SYSU D8015 TaxID=2593644 RepID=UPI001CB703F6|nr:hypothetical protein [Nonomuraea sp. SYSU D8015]
MSAERIARLGYDCVCLDVQHGLLGYSGLLSGLTAIDAGGVSAGLVRVGANDPARRHRAGPRHDRDRAGAGEHGGDLRDPSHRPRGVAATWAKPVAVRDRSAAKAGVQASEGVAGRQAVR